MQDLLVNGTEMLGGAYLNTAAEGLLLRAAAEAVPRYLADKATGEPGRVAMWAEHQKARELAGRLFGVGAAQIALVSSTTEALNSKIQWIKYTARGFGSREGYRRAIYFHCGGLDLYPQES